MGAVGCLKLVPTRRDKQLEYTTENKEQETFARKPQLQAKLRLKFGLRPMHV